MNFGGGSLEESAQPTAAEAGKRALNSNFSIFRANFFSSSIELLLPSRKHQCTVRCTCRPLTSKHIYPPPNMNISQPVGSQIAGVSFGFLASKDIRALSAKRITTATTFDTLLNPVPGGLYTPELGQFGDNNCATCGLKTPQCPGHCGHIELPVPCYHPTFMDQVLRLLRASCIYCGKLKLSRVHVNRFACKLRLVQYGLIKEIADLDDITAQMGAKGKATTTAAGSSDEDDDEISGDAKELVETRDRFVKKAIKKARQEGRLTTHKT